MKKKQIGGQELIVKMPDLQISDECISQKVTSLYNLKIHGIHGLLCVLTQKMISQTESE